MYYNPYAPRIGPATMPSPRSRIAPYFSGRRETFDDFLEEFEARAYDCRLTDLQQVDALVRYVDPSLRETCKSLSGYRSCNWHQFRNSLIHTFGTITPRHQVMEQKLRDLVEDSSRMRMDHEDDVLQYYQSFRHYSDPLVHSSYLTEEDRDIEFWYGFHPRDRDVLRPRLLALRPFQPHDIPFRLEHVYDCASRAFAYKERPSFRPREQEFEPRSISHKYSPSLMSDPRLGPVPSFSHMFSVSLSKPAPSAPEDKFKPEPEATPSIIPPAPVLSPTPIVTEPESSIVPTSFPLPGMPSSCTEHASSHTNVVPEPETTLSPITPPTSLSLLPTTSLASSCTNIIPEPEPTPTSTPSKSIITASSAPSELEHAALSLPQSSSARSLAPSSFAPRCADDTPKLVSAPPPLSSIPPDSECHEEPEPERSASTNPSLDVPLSSPFNSPSVPPASCEFPPVSLSQSFVLGDLMSQSRSSLSPVRSASEVVPEPECSNSSSLNSDALLSSTIDSPASNELLPTLFLFSPASCEPGPTLASAADLFLPSCSESSSESCETIPFPPSPLEVSNVPVLPHSSTLQARSQERTLGVTSREVTPVVTSTPPSATNTRLVHPSFHSDRSHAFPLLSTIDIDISSSNHDHPSSPGELVHIVPTPPLEASNVPSTHSSPSQPPYEIVQDDSFSGSLEDSLNIPIPFHLTPSQPPPGFAPIDLFSPSLEIALAPTSPAVPSIPQQRPLEVTPPEVSSTPPPFTANVKLESPALSSTPPDLPPASHPLPTLALVYIFTTVLVSVLINVSKTLIPHARKSWSKNEDFGTNQNGTLNSGNGITHRHAQRTPRPARLVFDPGGLVRFKHYTKMFASASRSHMSPSSPRTTPASPPSFQAIVSSLFNTETRKFSLVRA